MNTKMIAVLLAASFATAAHAEQQFGRDSVYAGKGVVPTTSQSGPSLTRYGRDSVYASNSAPLKQPTRVASDFVYKLGRT
ncbi:MAG: hypothetical protein ABI612_19430 [Betaproteobacteria bacterium]